MAKIKQDVAKRALEWVTKVNEEFDSLTSRVRDKWLDYYRMYRAFENQQKLPGKSNIFIPKIYEIIEKKTPPVIENQPSFLLTPRVNEANQFIGPLRDTLAFWWDEDRMQEKLEVWVKEAYIYGVGLVKVDWSQETKMETSVETSIDPETQEIIETEVEEEVVAFERPTAELVSIFDIKVDPRVETFQEGVGVLHTINDVRWADLMAFDEDVYDLSELKGRKPEEFDDDGFPVEEAREQEDDKGINNLAGEIDKNRITIQEFWGRFSKTDDPADEKEYIITVVVSDGEPKAVIRVEENELGFRPFVKMDDRRVRGEFYSIGEVEPLEGLQVEYNNLRNARIDFNNSVNYPEWIYNVNAGINPANLVHRPNNIIPVDLPIGSDIRGVIRPVDKPVQPMSGYNEESQLNRDFQTVSQTIDFTDRGGAAGFTNTARGVLARTESVNSQVNNIVRHLEAAIAEVGRMWLGLAEKFSEEELMVRRPRTEEDAMVDEIGLDEVEQKFTKIDREVLKDVLFNFTVKIEAGSTTANDARGKAQDAVNIANTAAQYAALGVPVDLTKVFKDILRDSFQKSNPENYIKEQPQMQLPEQGGVNTMPTEGAPAVGKVPIQPSQPNLI